MQSDFTKFTEELKKADELRVRELLQAQDRVRSLTDQLEVQREMYEGRLRERNEYLEQKIADIQSETSLTTNFSN
jgi:hypothetical protein